MDNTLSKYDEIKETGMRYNTRNLLLRIAWHLVGINKNITNNTNKKVQFIYSHHVMSDEMDKFEKKINKLKESYTFVPYSKAVKKVLDGPIDDKYISISFDDGISNCVKIGKLLARYDISACFFVCPGAIEDGNDEIACKVNRRIDLPPTSFMSWDDIEYLRSLGHEIGGHTYSHRNLASAAVPEIKREIFKTYDALQRKVDGPIHFAWPYGGFEHFTDTAARMVFDAGFASCASAVRGCHTHVSNRPLRDLCLRRDHFIAGEPLRHLETFLELNNILPWRQRNSWPATWQV
ncbi:MAG: polysaccharide deacetylase family protein [Candidatus Paceibacteria bacterium]